MIRIISDTKGMIIDISAEEIFDIARYEVGVRMQAKAAEAWIANNHDLIRKGLKRLIKSDLVRNNKKFLN